MLKKVLIIFSISTSIFFIGCSEENSTQPGPTASTNVPLSKLSDIQRKVFTQTCALSNCHGSANNQANLLLTNGNAFANLVNIQSLLFPQFKRVAPNNSSQSLIIKILRGEVNPRMPLNRNPLDPAVIDSIAKWIDLGALNN